jgi:hypothetical protein
MTPKEILDTHGAIHIKDLIGPELQSFLTNILLRAKVVGYGKTNGDSQVPTSHVVDHEIVFETLLEKIWPQIEALLGTSLSPTYAYARLYGNGDELKIHKDRPACEISMTVQLGRSHHYAWPIYMGGKRYDMAEGDAVIYRGCDIEHWRNPCDGPEGYYSGQVFLHFVDANGPFSNEACDASVREVIPSMFMRNRCFLMDNK